VSAATVIPSGTVTLLFTDVEGSTRLWEAEPEAMGRALRRHDEILRGAIADAGGFTFKTVGDAFCAAFATPQAALAAALAAQQRLGAEPWPTSRPVRVRMGLHTGVCEERDNDYFGPAVNRAARLEAVAHGGQVLVSGATAELLSDVLPGGVSLRDLGLHRLKDLERPEQVFQLEAGFLQAAFPPLASLDNPELPNNLPSLPSPFVGRERELAEVRDLLAAARVVTLTGAGGCGKTRLALQAAAELLGRSRDGAWFAELAPLTDGEQIPAAVAGVLGLPDPGGQPSPGPVVAALREQDALILLDNCEHVIDAAAKFCAEVTRSCPRVRVLATSREPLGIDGERVYRVPSMSLPAADAGASSDLAGSDAAGLFVERARARDAGFTVDDAAAPLIASVCRRLDGIPLALELAAARLSSMSLAQLSQRLDQRFRLLTGGSRGALPRQQTLQATVDWSFALLHQAERETLRRLAVFAGGFELEAAEAVAAAGAVEAFDVLDLLGSLVDKSLVVADHAGDSVRYRLLETIRQYAAEELLKSGGETDVLAARDRHAAYYLRLAETAGPELAGPGQRDWLRRLDLEWENIRAAFAHLSDEDRAGDVLRLGTALERFAASRGHAEILAWLRGAVDEAAQQPGVLLTQALLVTSELICLLFRKDARELAAAQPYAERAVEAARALGDRLLEARTRGHLGTVILLVEGDRAAVRALLEPAVTTAREAGDMRLLGQLLATLAPAAESDAETRAIREEAVACSQRAGDDLVVVTELHHLYGLNLHAGLLDRADDALAQSIALADAVGGELLRYFLRQDLALLRLIQGRPEEAAPIVRSCLLVVHRIGVQIDASETIFAAACCAAWQGDHERAARLFGAADADISAALEARAIRWSRSERQLGEEQQSQLRQALGEERYAEAYRRGAELSPAQAVELALGRERPG
jgi:predicted ATPase/class 3 adenylate cyclase